MFEVILLKFLNFVYCVVILTSARITMNNSMCGNAPFIQKRVNGKLYPWLSSEIKGLMNERDKAMRKSRRTKNDIDIAAYKLLKNRCNIKIHAVKIDITWIS